MDELLEKRMYIIDKKNQEYFIRDSDDINFIYHHLNLLQSTNSSIHVLDDTLKRIFLNTRDINSIFIINEKSVKIWLR